MTSNAQLSLLHQSSHYLSDGTFSYRPMDIQCAQLYLLFAMVGTESQLAVQSLMPDKTEASYQTFFTFVRQELLNRYQTIGNIVGGVIHMDNERASYNAAQNIFPEAKIRTCAFHFAQSVLRHVNTTGLKALYEQSTPRGYNVHPFTEFKRYVRTLFAFMMLPAQNVMPAWQSNFQNPPLMNNLELDNKIREFVQYFETHWLSSLDHIQRWNHHDHDGPRTTNHCEAYNSSLASKFQVGCARMIYRKPINVKSNSHFSAPPPSPFSVSRGKSNFE